MKINYKKFTKHAEKMVKTAKHIKARPILQGINHDAEGNLTVTDSHRLYYAKGVNAPKDVILHAVTGEEMDHGNYPETSRLIPDESAADTVINVGNIDELLKAAKAMQQAGTVDRTKKSEVLAVFKDGNFSLDTRSAVSFDYKLDHVEGDEMAATYFNLSYLVDSLEMLADMGAESVKIRLYGSYRPFTIAPSQTSDILALILPVRRNISEKMAS